MKEMVGLYSSQYVGLIILYNKNDISVFMFGTTSYGVNNPSYYLTEIDIQDVYCKYIRVTLMRLDITSY